MAHWIGFAADLGASNGRTVLGSFDGTKLYLRELNRFPNTPRELNGTYFWDFPRIYGEIEDGLHKAIASGQVPMTLGVDSWGVDFGLIDKHGDLIANPRHYRNAYFVKGMEEVFRVIRPHDLFAQTGIQLIQINTVYQLAYLHKYRPEILEVSRHLVLFPDLVNYFLTGELASEFTHASTTQLFNPHLGTWDYDTIGKLGFKRDLFLPIRYPLSKLGQVRQSITGKPVTVVNIGEHDTSSAVLAVPHRDDDHVYISSGTWSLVGVVSDQPVITDLTMRHNFTNEGGVAGGYRLLKNVMGLWLLQEVRRQFLRSGIDYDFAGLTQLSLQEESLVSLFDPDLDEFLSPPNMIDAIQAYCRRTNQIVPQTAGAITRSVFESLVLRYRWTVERLEEILDKPLLVIHIVGGGSQNETLCQWTADSTNRVVIAGPVEATVIGNLCAQLIVSGELSGCEEIPQLVTDSFETKVYFPIKDRSRWEMAYSRFLRLLDEERSS